ncbi:hypothetical protein EJB05_09840, partial [Eragrostis curvula]
MRVPSYRKDARGPQEQAHDNRALEGPTADPEGTYKFRLVRPRVGRGPRLPPRPTPSRVEFHKDCKHAPYRIRKVTSTTPSSSSAAAAAIDATVPHVGTSQSRRRRRPSSSSFIARALKAIYNKCTKNAIEIREAREEARARQENSERNIRNLCKANKVPYAAPPPYPELPSDGDDDEDIFNFTKKPTRQEESDEDTEVEGEGEEEEEEESEEEDAAAGSDDAE